MRDRAVLIVAIGGALALPALLGTGHAGNLGVVAVVFAMLSVSFNLIFGMTGYLALTHTGCFGLGAYTAALGATRMGWPFSVNIAVGALVGALFAFAFGSVAFRRVRAFPFAIVSLGTTITLWIVADRWISVTRGPMALYGVPRPIVFGEPLSNPIHYFYFGAAILAVMVVIAWEVQHRDIGRVLLAIRDNERMVVSLGLDTFRYKLWTFVAASSMAAIAGVYYAHYLSVVSPDVFWLYWITMPLVVVHVAGLGRLWAVIGVASVLAIVPDYLRVSQGYQQLLFGILLVAVVTLVPDGIGGWFAARQRRRS